MKRLAFRGEAEQALAAVAASGFLLYQPTCEQILEDASEALLGDLQDGEEFADRQVGVSAYEVERAVVGAAEADRRQFAVGLRQEVAVTEEQLLDATAQFVLAQIKQRRGLRANRRFYVSHVDIFIRDQ